MKAALAIMPALLAACIASEIGLELCFKIAARPVIEHAARKRWLALARLAPMWGGVALWVIEMLIWIAVLQHVPLSVAYPVMALTFAGVPLARRLLLGERLGRTQWAGILLVVAGVACVGASGI